MGEGNISPPCSTRYTTLIIVVFTKLFAKASQSRFPVKLTIIEFLVSFRAGKSRLECQISLVRSKTRWVAGVGGGVRQHSRIDFAINCYATDIG